MDSRTDMCLRKRLRSVAVIAGITAMLVGVAACSSNDTSAKAPKTPKERYCAFAMGFENKLRAAKNDGEALNVLKDMAPRYRQALSDAPKEIKVQAGLVTDAARAGVKAKTWMTLNSAEVSNAGAQIHAFCEPIPGQGPINGPAAPTTTLVPPATPEPVGPTTSAPPAPDPAPDPAAPSDPSATTTTLPQTPTTTLIIP